MIRFSIRSVLLLTMLVALVLTGLRRGEQTEQLKKLASDLRLVGFLRASKRQVRAAVGRQKYWPR